MAAEDVRTAVQSTARLRDRSQRTGAARPPACGCGDPISSDLYSSVETADLPREAVAVSLGAAIPRR
jgi:hypothetical protein